MTAPRPYVPGQRQPAVPRQTLSRWAELKIWWREIDRVMLLLVLILMAFGTVAVAAASPASAARLSTAAEKLNPLYFFYRHIAWQAVGLAVMFGASLLTREQARRFGVLLTGIMLFFMCLVPILGAEVNGAKRWIDLGIRFQPSEFLGPGFAIALAWIMSWRMRDPKLPVVAISTGLVGFVTLLLMVQPNLGTAILFAGVWFVMILLAGVDVKRIGMLLGGSVVLLLAAYFLYDNARHRIDDFLGGGTAFDQVDLASRTLNAGGWLGAGYGLGIRKMSLPEAHTDYIFSVIGEEFGLLACAVVIILYLAIVARVMMRLVEEEDYFALLAGAGIGAQLGGQAFINILVNLQLFPSKGMTLPLVSYGGSSTIAICLAVGLLIAISRRNPFLKTRTRGLGEALGLGQARGMQTIPGVKVNEVKP